MSFLAPANLLLLGLLALIAIAYLLRMPRRLIRVPDAGIARLALADHSRINRQRRTVVSLALQVAILVLLAIAAAMPLFGDGRKGNRSIIVMLDVSASMRADDSAKFRVLADNEKMPVASSSRFQKAVEAVRGLARGMRPGDHMMLMTVGRTADVVFNFQSDQAVIVHALDAVCPSAEEANFVDACRLAAQIAGVSKSAEIVLVTGSALKAPDVAPLTALGASAIKLVKVGQQSGNLGITNFRVRKNMDSPTDYEALVSLASTLDQPRKVEVELSLNGSVFDIAAVDVPAGGEAVQMFREKLHVGGVLEARLRIVDSLADDNVAWEILRPPNRLRVLLVSDDTSPSSFLVRAVGSNAGALEGLVITPEQYRQTIASNPAVLVDQRDAIIFDRWIPDKAEQLPLIHMLAIDCVPPGMPVTSGEPFDKPLIRKWEQGHPLMSYLNLRNVFISSARRMTVGQGVKGQPPVERVAELVSSPLVLAWERPMPNGAGDKSKGSQVCSAGNTRPQRFVVMAFNPRESDIVLRKELPLLLWNSFLWFQNASEPATQVSPGGTIALDASQCPGAASVIVTTPAGETRTVSIDPSSGAAFFSATDAPGVYRYRVGKKEDAFAVNCGRREATDVLRLDPLGGSAVGAIGDKTVRPVDDLGFKPQMLDAAKLAATPAGDRNIWPYLLMAAAAILIFETIVFHRRIYF